MASIWKGSITFGLVSIPVELRSAVRSDGISFRMLHEDDLSSIEYERVCAAEGEPVPWSEIVKGYEYSRGKFVVMTEQDFKAAALESSKVIDIIDFVKQDEIDPHFFATSIPKLYHSDRPPANSTTRRSLDIGDEPEKQSGRRAGRGG